MHHDPGIEALQFGHVFHDLLKIDRPEHFGFRIAHHTDCPSGIDDQYLVHVCFVIIK